MLSLSLLALAAAAHASPLYSVERVDQTASAGGAQHGVSLPPAKFSVALTGKVPARTFKKEMMKTVLTAGDGGNNTASLDGSGGDAEYITDVTIGGQTFKAIVDTGSSDTWLVSKGFKCSDLQGNPVSAATCGFGSDGFDTNSSSTFKPIANKNFNISYGDGEFLTGTIANETVTVGGLTVTDQTIGVGTNTAWQGDHVSSGLIGLAYPAITSAFTGTDPKKDSSKTRSEYNPFFFTAVAEGLTDPYFSVSLDRGKPENSNSTTDPNLGVLAFGGIAPVDVEQTAVTLPIQQFQLSSVGGSKPIYAFYSINVDGYNFTGAPSGSSQAILDTGTTLNYLPSNVASAYNKAFGATLNPQYGIYTVDCNATAPDFSVTLGGTSFTIDARDMMLEDSTVGCISGIQDGGGVGDGSIFILGDVFLHNVVSTFNIEKNEVTVTQRTKY